MTSISKTSTQLSAWIQFYKMTIFSENVKNKENISQTSTEIVKVRKIML